MIDLSGDTWRLALEKGLGAEVVDLEGLGVLGHRLVIFRRGPWKVGYADFVAGNPDLDEGYLQVVSQAAARGRVDVLRFQSSMPAAGSPHHARFPLPSSLITTLQNWDERKLEKPRRTANRIVNSEVTIRRADRSDGAVIHEIYLGTLRRHGGAARYTLDYFTLIAEESCWIASVGDEVLGFVAVGAAGGRGLYLHGGHRDSARKHYPSDLLFLTMLREAKAAGLACFDFLASPPKQRNLLHYKQAWGGEARDVIVSDLPLSVAGHTFSIAYAAIAAFRRR